MQIFIDELNSVNNAIFSYFFDEIVFRILFVTSQVTGLFRINLVLKKKKEIRVIRYCYTLLRGSDSCVLLFKNIISRCQKMYTTLTKTASKIIEIYKSARIQKK